MENSTTHLRRAAIGYLVAGMGFIAFGFPFWFLNAVDKTPKGKFTPPFFFVVDDPMSALASNWIQLVSAVGLAVGAYSLWQAGEPTGFGKRRSLLFVQMAGGISYIVATWILLPFAPIGAFLNGFGMILVGYASIKANVWTGWKPYTPLIVGLFPFLFMFPLVILTGARPAAIIGLWGFAWILLSLAAWQRSKEISSVKFA